MPFTDTPVKVVPPSSEVPIISPLSLIKNISKSSHFKVFIAVAIAGLKSLKSALNTLDSVPTTSTSPFRVLLSFPPCVIAAPPTICGFPPTKGVLTTFVSSTAVYKLDQVAATAGSALATVKGKVALVFRVIKIRCNCPKLNGQP